MNTMNNAAPLNLDILAFNDSYDKAQHIHRAWLSAVWAATTILIAVFAIVTSLQSLRILAALSLILPIPFFIFALQNMGKIQEIKKPLQTGGGLFVASIAFVIASFSFYGFGLADEKDITELVTPEVSKAAIEASRDKEEDAILAAIQRAKANPSEATFMALIPYLDKVQTNVILPDGEVRQAGSLVRSVLWSDQQLLFRTLHKEAITMASLLPADAVAPQQVEVNVAKRLEFALKNLIAFHSEKVMTESFDTPTVGVNILVKSEEEENEHGFSNREIGITFPFGSHMMGDTLKVNPALIEELLGKIKKDLAY
jgi:hypothetical protein